MISSIQIRGYRGFEDFEMSGLERINLLVGANNSGKTSVLEAIHILISRGDPWALWSILSRRGERISGTERNPSRPPDLDVSHLFNGHDAHLGSKFVLSAKNQTPDRLVAFQVSETKAERPGATVPREQLAIASRLVLHVTGKPSPPMIEIPLTRSGGIFSESFDAPRRIRRRAVDEYEVPAQFITAESLEGDELVTLWDKVALTSNEGRVLTALRFLDDSIERIAPQASSQFYRQRGGFIVKLKDREQPLPIGSMGDGMWRMMAMAITIAHCKGGVLLVDEIDTGLHYTVLENMWRLIVGAAKELDVQVFATTHSSDCIKSLAELSYAETDVAENVTLQRIERGRTKAVPYSANEIEIAAEKQIEVR